MDEGEFVNEAINFANRLKKVRFMRQLEKLNRSLNQKIRRCPSYAFSP
jgi:hypothetical protein